MEKIFQGAVSPARFASGISDFVGRWAQRKSQKTARAHFYFAGGQRNGRAGPGGGEERWENFQSDSVVGAEPDFFLFTSIFMETMASGNWRRITKPGLDPGW